MNATASTSSGGPRDSSTSPSRLPGGSPCSPSILLNPLPPRTPPSRRRPSITVTSITSGPPAHWLAENPDYVPPPSQHQACSSSPPYADHDLPGSRSSSADRAGDAAAAEQKKHNNAEHCKFAPLPPGRRAYRSNSLTIGVAARARMLSSQNGPSTPYSNQTYAGPQMWYTSGMVPGDVYTYHDLTKGVKKLWSGVRRRSSSSATSSSSAQSAEAMERAGKSKSKEIEHIEEAVEDSAEDVLDSDSDDERGRSGSALGLSMMGSSRGSDSGESLTSSAASDQPATPEMGHDIPLANAPPASRKGKEVDRSPMPVRL
ncbi:hypothetical protein MNV49_003305 [Pseudohyphozyma bogoriensis]|nr:hypothetical protein MNV49_003305 [Pseudohyphozyma bogoriensis]